MRTSSRIDLAVFQLSPTRTRCDLLVLSNGRTEKIASGLLNPFLSHLKLARDQMAVGGYSIELKPDPGYDASWFTKGTVERFVRFVSTPEVLERVNALESEILQIEEAIAMQTNKKGGIPSAEESLGKSVDSLEATKPVLNTDDDKAIVLYKTNSQSAEVSGSPVQEGNSKVDLLKVLETRRNLLQNEQGMAFARAAAAGFDIDVMDTLISFSECFGAARLMNACKRYLDLWKKKHESGQWLEIEAAEAALSQSDLMATNASDIAFTDASNRNQSTPENNAEKSMTDHQASAVHQENLQGQYPNPVFPPWQFQSPHGVPPGYQPYPVVPMPHYPNYPANGPYLQQAFSLMQGQRSKTVRTSRHKSNSHHNKESNSESEASDKDFNGNYSDESEKETEIQRKKRGSSDKKKSGVVVVHNINYISSKVQYGSDGAVHLANGSGKHDDEARTVMSARYGNHFSDTNEASCDNEIDGGDWQAFQNYLLKDNEEEDATGKGMFSMEKVGKMRRLQKKESVDPLDVGGGDVGQYEEDYEDIQLMRGSTTYRGRTSADEMLISRVGDQKDSKGSLDGHLDAQSNHINGRISCRRTDNEDFMVQGRDEISIFSQSDIPAESKYKTVHRDSNLRSCNNTNDDVYLVSLRSNLLEPEATGRQTLDIDSEFPSGIQQVDRASKKVQPNYEPDYMSLMPERETENGSSNYNPAIDYELHAERLKESVQNMNEEAAAAKNKGPKKDSKDQNMKLTQDAVRTTGTMRKGRPKKLSPLDEARARAERMRSYKADLQKIKKEKEEEQLKRLEALKIERQKRIAARSNSIPGQSSSLVDSKQLPSKLSLSSKPSKFTDAEPGSSSPLQRSTKRTTPVGSIESPITIKQSSGSRLSRSVSSLPEALRDSCSTKPDVKASMARIRRLLEPRMTSDGLVPLVKPQSTEANRRRMNSESDSKKISEIINLDKSKAATLPELKIRTSKPSNGSQSNLADGKNSLTVSGNEQDKPRNIAAGVTRRGDVDDNSIVEKNVVVLEFEKPSAPQPCTSQDKDHLPKKHHDGHISIEKTEPFLQNVNWQSANASVILEGDTIQVQERIRDLQTYNSEASPSTMKINSTEKQYQAPYARISPLEDPFTENSEYCKAPPACLDSKTEVLETVKVHVSDLHEVQMRSLPETVEKQSSAKGFKRLLKFGRKSSNSESSKCIGELDNVSVDESEMNGHASYAGPSNEVYTLKNLLSQDETPTEATTPKKSSSFSLLSPFRSKSGKKKNVA